MHAVTTSQTNDHYEVEMAAPGMNKSDFKVQLEGNLLTISLERKDEKEERDGENYSRREFSYQSFSRSFSLPKDVVEAENIKARYADVALKLQVPKRELAKLKPPGIIEIA